MESDWKSQNNVKIYIIVVWCVEVFYFGRVRSLTGPKIQRHHLPRLEFTSWRSCESWSYPEVYFAPVTHLIDNWLYNGRYMSCKRPPVVMHVGKESARIVPFWTLFHCPGNFSTDPVPVIFLITALWIPVFWQSIWTVGYWSTGSTFQWIRMCRLTHRACTTAIWNFLPYLSEVKGINWILISQLDSEERWLCSNLVSAVFLGGSTQRESSLFVLDWYPNAISTIFFFDKTNMISSGPKISESASSPSDYWSLREKLMVVGYGGMCSLFN